MIEEKVLIENRMSDYWFNPGYPTLDLVKKSNTKNGSVLLLTSVDLFWCS